MRPSPGAVEHIYIPSTDQCDSQPFEVSWSSVADASGYTLRIADHNPPSTWYAHINAPNTTAEVSLSPGKYYFQVRAGNDVGCSGDRSPVDSLTVYAVPSGGVPVPVWTSSDRINICQGGGVSYFYWQAIPEATHYRVYENGEFFGLFGSQTTRIQHYHPLEGGEWKYWLQAKVGSCWGDISDTLTITRRYDPPPPEPAQPSTSPTTVCPNSTYTVYWSSEAGAVDYKLYENYIKVYEGSGLNFDCTNGNGPGSYEYYLKVSDGECWSNPGDKLYLVIPGPLDPPGLISPLNCATGISMPFTLDWEDVADFNAYRVAVDNNSDFTSHEIYEELLVSEYIVSSGLAPGETYYWRAMVHDDCGTSVWSSKRSFVMECPIPDPPILELPADGAMDVSQPVTWDWSDVSGATKYHIQVDNDNSDFNSLVVDNSNRIASDFTWDGLADATDYWWRVRSGNDCGWSDWSLVWTFSVDEETDVREIEELPEDGATVISQPVMWDRSDVSEATKYHIQVDKVDSDFNNLVITKFNILTSDFTYDGLA
ncbi:MAG: hypothetical protein KAW61_02410, partial [candidate division Zixibacteria bacterium]|nr:hypothetical protein [candidate division Zixibacteria bacterium]